MEDENNNMFDLDNVKPTNSVFDLNQEEEEEIIGIDVYDLNNKKWEYEFDAKKKTGEFLNLCLNDLGIKDDKHEIFFFSGRKKTFMDNEQTLEKNGIESLDELYLRKKEQQPIGSNNTFNLLSNQNKEPSVSSKLIHISVGESYDKMEEFDVDPNITVDTLLNIYKGKVSLKEKASVFVTFKGQILKNDKKLSEAGIGNGDKINLLVRLQGGLY